MDFSRPQPEMLRPLPFYDLIDELVKPYALISNTLPGRSNELNLDFRLDIEQSDMIAMSLGSKQILLRFFHLDPTTEQDDNFPPEVVVTLNGMSVPLPPAMSNPNKPHILPKRPGQHVDITKLCKICPFVANCVNVKWIQDPNDPNRRYVATIILAEKVSVSTLLQRIKSRGFIDPEVTKKLVTDSDNEIATTNLQSTLFCPLGKMRMTLPCKSVCCQHIPCFDALFYLQMNEKRAQWTCPVCYRPALYRDLMIDGYFMGILEQSDASVTEVSLHSDGSWSPVSKIEQPTSAKGPALEVITISDDDD